MAFLTIRFPAGPALNMASCGMAGYNAGNRPRAEAARRDPAGKGGTDVPRIVGGEARGRRLRSLPDRTARPTADRVKEALFNIVAARVPGSRVLDLFAGTGNLGLEALSRGAGRAVFVEADPRCRGIIEGNLRDLGFLGRARVVAGDAAAVASALGRRGERFDLVFLDPPYGKGLLIPALEAVAAGGLAAPDARVVAEHPAREALPERVGALARRDVRRYGDTALSFYAPDGREPSVPGETPSG